MTQKKLNITRRQFIKGSLILGGGSLLSLNTPELFAAKNSNLIRVISEFKNPYGVDVDSIGFIYVTDAGNYCVKIFNTQGELVRKIGAPGSKEGCLNFPQGIKVDRSGDVYVVDSNNGRIAIFDRYGKPKGSIGAIGGYPGAFYTPKGLFISSNKIYVANTRNHMIYVFSKSTHQLEASYGLLGDDPVNLDKGSLDYKFRLPTDIAISRNGQLYIVDSKHGQIKVLDANGKFLFKFGKNGSRPGELNFPEGIAIDSKQIIYVCDSLNGRIQKYTIDGDYLDKIDQGFEKPAGIAIDSNDTLYVVDSANNVLKIFNWV